MPDPIPSARVAFAHRRLQATFKPGTVVAATTTAVQIAPIAGAEKIRIRGKLTGADTTIDLEFMCPDGKTVYAEGQPDSITTTDGTEFSADATASGESRLRITVNGDASDPVTIAFIDLMALPS